MTTPVFVEPKSKERPGFIHEIADNLPLRTLRRLGPNRVHLDCSWKLQTETGRLDIAVQCQPEDRKDLALISTYPACSSGFSDHWLNRLLIERLIYMYGLYRLMYVAHSIHGSELARVPVQRGHTPSHNTCYISRVSPPPISNTVPHGLAGVGVRQAVKNLVIARINSLSLFNPV